MKFNEYPTLYSWAARRMRDVKEIGYDAFYATILAQNPDETTYTQTLSERIWHDEHRPYYNVWPSIIDPLLRLDLSKVPTSSIQFPVHTLALRLSEDNRVGEFEANGEKFWLRSILVSIFDARDAGRQVPPDSKALVCHLDIGEVGYHYGATDDAPIVTWRRFPLHKNETIQEALDSSDLAHFSADQGIQVPKETVRTAYKIVAACGLLESDSSIIIPDVLNRDKKKFDPENPNPKMLERAKRNGKYGWNIGEAVERGEASPHFRAQHMALYHVGKGRKRTVARFRSGGGKGGPIIVHRDKMTQMPTGREDQDDE